MSDDAIGKLFASDAAQLGQHHAAVGARDHIRVGGVQSDCLVRVENQWPSARLVLDEIERAAAIQRGRPRVDVQCERDTSFSSRRAGRRSEQRTGLVVKRIRLGVITEFVPERHPPAARAKETGDLRESGWFVEPMESRGAHCEVEGASFENCVLERRNHDVQSPAGIVLAQESGKAPVRLDGHQRIGTQLEQAAGSRTRACTDLEDCRVRVQTTPRGQRFVDPIGIWRPRAVVTGGVVTESVAAEFLGEFVSGRGQRGELVRPKSPQGEFDIRWMDLSPLPLPVVDAQ